MGKASRKQKIKAFPERKPTIAKNNRNKKVPQVDWSDVNLEQLATSNDTHFRSFRKSGTTIIQRLWELLSQKSKFDLNRYLIAGSVGKRTNLGVSYYPDFDVVIFVNDIQPPINSVVKDFAQVLEQHKVSCNGWRYLNVTSEGKSLQFNMTRKMFLGQRLAKLTLKFDFCIGINLADVTRKDQDIEKMQVRNTLRAIHRSRRPLRASNQFSASLAERTVSFVRGQRLFVHHVIRLAKMWLRETKISGPGYTFMFELIAVKACVKAKSKLSKAFRKFLIMVSQYQDLSVYFSGNCSPNHYLYPNFRAMADNERPLVLDPANPYNNLAKKISPEHWIVFGQAAKEKLEVLNRG